MKKFFTALTLLASISMAHGAPKYLAKLTSQGGFVPPHLSGPNGAAIRYDGVVVQITRTGEIPMARLSEQKRQALIHEVNLIRGGKLVDPDEDKPMCTDTPTVSYVVTNSRGVTTEIAHSFGCHDSQLMGAQGKPWMLKSILDGLNDLGQAQ